ncbi:MAG: D-glycerate dehydrogenase, partial [Candidatus Sungbacteria bacterium]|nr:D-glycerate dehydrogenase [Candidatus Sungbacteria bacterium]
MKVFITRKIPNKGIDMLKAKGFDVIVSPHDRVLTKDELISIGRGADAVLAQLTDKIDGSVVDEWGGTVKIIANYAVGYDNLKTAEIAAKGVAMSNTPDVLTETVAEHAMALLLSIAHRIVESDKFSRAGKYHGWEPELLLGTDMSHKTLGIVGLGRIGSRVAHHAAHGFDMNVLYYDIKRNLEFEKEFSARGGSASGGEKEVGASFRANAADVFKESDFISIHVPLLDSTRH